MRYLLLGYIDPGMGLMVWQLLVAAVVGLLFYVQKSRDWIVGAIRRLFRRKPDARQDPPE